jgi:hypothetical protein
MINYWANNNGNWSTVSNWLTAVGQTAGVLPTSADDVYANNKIIYVDGNYKVNSISNRSATNITAGGYFVMNNGYSLSADVYSGGVSDVACLQFLSAAPASASLVGNFIIQSTPFVLRPVAFINSSSGTFNIIGNLDGGINNGQDAVLSTNTNGLIINAGSGNINLIGSDFYSDVRFPSANTKLVGIRNNSTGNISIIGDIYGGTSTDSYGIYNLSSGSIFVQGNIYAGDGTGATGLYNNSTGFISVTGLIFAGFASSGSTGITNVSGNAFILGGVFGGFSSCIGYNLSGGTSFIYGDVEGGFGSLSYGINNASVSNPKNIFVFGNITGGIGSQSHGFFNGLGQGQTSIVGNVRGGGNASSAGFFNINALSTPISISGNIKSDIGAGVLNSGSTNISIIGTITSDTSKAGVENTSTGGNISIFGNCLNGSGLYAVLNSSSAAISIVGTVSGGSGANSYSVFNASNGSIVVTGPVYGGNNTLSEGIRNNSTGSIFVSGDITGGNGLSGVGIFNVSTGSVFITGSSTGGTSLGSTGVYNFGSGTINIVGNAIGGFLASGVENKGTMRITKAIGNNFGPTSTGGQTYQVGVVGLSGSITIVDEIECGPKGVFPTRGLIYTSNSKDSIATYKNQSYQTITMFNYVSGSKYVPLQKDVRFNEFYSLKSLSGTLILPDPLNVNFGVPTDNTTGLLSPSLVWNVPLSAINTIGSMGKRVKQSPILETLDLLIKRIS